MAYQRNTVLPQSRTLVSTAFIKSLEHGGVLQSNSMLLGELIDSSMTATEFTISLMLVEPSRRSELVQRKLMKLTKDIDFFVKLMHEHPESVHMDCCKYMRYELAPAGSFVFNFGEQADKFYIIIEGTCEVQVPDSVTQTLSPIATLTSGQAFGDLALIKSQPRMAGIYAKTVCHLATLTKSDYNNVLAAALSKKLEAKVKFLSSQHIFKDWTKMSLSKLSYFFHENHLKQKAKLYKEGTPVSKIFLVKQGEFKVYKTISSEAASKLKSPKQTVKNARIDLVILSTGEFMGIEDLMARKVHSSSCESLGPGEYYTIDAQVTPT
jgi:CRP-like cAMP-binding protein